MPGRGGSKPVRTWTRRRAIPDLDAAAASAGGPRPLAPFPGRAELRGRACDPRGLRLLEAHPKAGRPAAGMDPAFREWWIAFGGNGYLALYRLDGPHVVVLAVRHGGELRF